MAGLMDDIVLAISCSNSTGTPEISEALWGGYSMTVDFKASKSSQFSSTKRLSYRFSLIRMFIIPFRKAMSEPTLIWAKISAFLASACFLGSATMSFAPFFKARFTKYEATGWASVMLVPMRKNSRAFSNSPKELVIAPEPKVVARPATVGACQVLAQ